MNFKNIFLLASIGISFSLTASNPKSDEEKYVQYPDDDVWGPPEHNQPQPAPVPSASAGHPRMQQQQPAYDHEKDYLTSQLRESFSHGPEFALLAMNRGALHQQRSVQRQGAPQHQTMVLARIQSATQGTEFNTQPLDEYYLNKHYAEISPASTCSGQAVPKNIPHENRLGTNLQKQQRISNIKWCLGSMAVGAAIGGAIAKILSKKTAKATIQ